MKDPNLYKEILKYEKWVREAHRDPYLEYLRQKRKWHKSLQETENRV